MDKNRRITLMRPSQIFDSFMDEFFNLPSLRFGGNEVQVDMFEDEDKVTVKIKAPGFAKDKLDINIEGDLLTVSGSIKEEKEEGEDKRKYYMKEIREESFSRSVALPSKVDAEKADAKVEDGMIKIVMPKLPESKTKKISISAS